MYEQKLNFIRDDVHPTCTNNSIVSEGKRERKMCSRWVFTRGVVCSSVVVDWLVVVLLVNCHLIKFNERLITLTSKGMLMTGQSCDQICLGWMEFDSHTFDRIENNIKRLIRCRYRTRGVKLLSRRRRTLYQ